jgi:hypothetical protein
LAQVEDENVVTMNKFLLRRLGVADDPGSYRPTLQDCIEAVLSQSDALVADVLGGLQSSGTSFQGRAAVVQFSAPTKAAIEVLTGTDAAFKKAFAKSLRVAVYGGDTQRGPAGAEVRFDDFQFLEEDQIDANIELALTQQEVLLAVESVLPALNGMISSLMGWVTVQGNLNPLKPEAFVQALRESLTVVVPQDAVRVRLMTPAATLLGNSLRQLYKEIVDWLRSQGIEPASMSLTSVGAFGVALKAAATPASRTMLTLDKLRRLLSGELDPSPTVAGVKDFMNTVPASFVALEDMKLVEPMMKRLAERAAQASASPDAPRGKATFVQSDPLQTKRLGRQLGEEVVRLMLENLMQDRRLMPAIRQHLKTLEPVLIALSQEDARFFTERQHAARQFLDRITHRSLAFSSEDEPGYGRFQKVLENAVNVLAHGGGDGTAFARVLRKLEEGWQREEHVQRKRAEEAARSLLHAEQRNLLAQRLATDFSERMAHKKVPELVVAFLRGPWAQVVAESQLLCADGSLDPDGYLALVDDLLWSVQVRLARRNRTRLVGMVPGMLVKLRQGLGLISFPQERIAVLFDALIALHEKAFESVRAAPLEDDKPALDSVAPEEFWVAKGEATDSGYMQYDDDASRAFVPPVDEPETPELLTWTTDSLATGSWVDLALAGSWVRAQLTWTSPQRTLFMFISGSGMAHSMSLRTLNRLHNMGLIRLVSDGHVMDNALDAVARAALHNDMQKASGDS